MKKRFLLTAAVSVMTLAASAQLQGDGYYRVYNLGLQTLKNKKCYTWVAADKVLIVNQAGTGQRFDAIELWSKTVKSPISEPASVIYATLNGSNIDLEAQGTSVSRMTDCKLTLAQNGTANSYTLSTVQAGCTLYLWAYTNKSAKHYIATTITNNSVAYKFWGVEPVSSSSDNYFGVQPTLEANGKYYAPFYASFPFKFASQGMKAYYVSSVDNDHYTLEEITTEVKPGATPMIIECSSNNVSDNRLDLLHGSYPAVKGNKLSGVYFCNDFYEDSRGIRTTFDPATMRVWNVENGQLVLSTATDNLHSSYYAGKANFPGELYNGYLNANQSYLTVSASASQTLTAGTTGVNDLNASAEAAKPVRYTTAGGMTVDAPQKGMGVVIVKYSDGTVRSVVY